MPKIEGSRGKEPQAPRVLVLGGAGFIGRHAAVALLAAEAEVVLGSRHPQLVGRRLGGDARGCPRTTVRLECMTTPEAWSCLVDYDAVLNCVGILRERGAETYDKVHHRGPSALAAACRQHGIPLVHVSAIGLHADARSGFLRSKRTGEDALLASQAEVCIVRPSLLDGEGGFGARWLRALARLPVIALPADAGGRIAALDVRDLGEALATIVLRAAAGAALPREIELGGPDAVPLREHIAALRRLHAPRAALVLPVPGWLARIASHACDLLHWSPFSFGHWELLRRDNCPRINLLPDLLGRPPRTVGMPAHIAVPEVPQPQAS